MKPLCNVRGQIAPGAMCVSIIVGARHCGYAGPCQHKVEFVDCAACGGAEGLPCSRCGGSGKVRKQASAANSKEGAAND